jgi:hypothetical protein
MIAVITITIVCIVLMINSLLRLKQNNIRVKELEKRLDEFYNKRENRLLKRFRDIEQ